MVLAFLLYGYAKACPLGLGLILIGLPFGKNLKWLLRG